MSGIIGYGSTFAVGTSELTEVVSIKWGGIEVGKADLTHMASTNGFKEFTPGLAESKEVEIELQYNDATVITLTALVRISSDYTITYPDGAMWTFNGFLTKLNVPEVKTEDAIIITASFQPTGEMQFTGASS